MAVLTTNQRHDTMRDLVRRLFVESGATATVSTDDIRAAVNALDDLFEDAVVRTRINSAFPEPFTSRATPAQKALVVAVVALRRAGAI